MATTIKNNFISTSWHYFLECWLCSQNNSAQVIEKIRNSKVPAYISHTKESQQQESAFCVMVSGKNLGLSQVWLGSDLHLSSVTTTRGRMLWCARHWFCLNSGSPRSRLWAKDFSKNSSLNVARNIGGWQGSQPIQQCYLRYWWGIIA